MAVNVAARMWGPYKELFRVVESAVLKKQQDAIQDLELVLRKHKPDFISLLQNPAKNNAAREAVRKSHIEGLAIQGQQATQLLTQQFIEEALIISDLFDLSEYAAVELLLAGENQQAYFPGLTRGLVAVLLYYDGRATLVNTLRLLIQARTGRTWALGQSEEVAAMTTKFTNDLLKEGLTGRILDLLGSMDLTAEIDRLQKERALGHARHRQEVLVKMKEIRLSLAECLFCCACQTPLEKADTLRLLAYLRTDSSSQADGSMEDVTMALVMALLYTLDVRLLEQQDSDEAADRLPLVSDPTFLPELHKEIASAQQWANPGIKAVIQLAWAITLRSISNYPGAPDFSDQSECDEAIVEVAIEDDVFRFLTNAVVATEMFHKEEYYVRQIHNIVTDLLVLMNLKVKEIRNRGDEAARIIVANLQEGLEPPANLRREFEHLMELIDSLYKTDPLGLQLAMEYWCPPDPIMGAEMSGFMTLSYRPPQRQVSLFKFVRLAGDLLPPPLFIPYLNMLAGLANGPQCAHHCYSLLKANGLAAGGQVSNVSWDHFFMSLNQYYASLRQEAPALGDLAHVYRHHVRGITPQEVEGLVGVLHLTRIVAEQDETSRISLCENQQWVLTVVLVGLVGCSVPPVLKSELLLTLAALARTPEVAARLWQALEVAQILPTVSATSLHPAGGIQVELDEIEARNEEYPLTRAFLRLMNSLTDNPLPAGLGVGYRAPGFQPYLEFLRDFIFLKFNTRAYRNPAEKWEVGALVLEVLHKLLSSHQVALDDFIDQSVEVQGEGTTVLHKPPGHVLMIHMMNDSPMLKMILFILDEAVKQLDKYTAFPGKEHLERTAILCLKMLSTTLDKQDAFLDALRETAASVMVSQMDKLLISINPRSGKADHLVNIAKYVTYNQWLPEHSLLAVRIMCSVCRSALVQPKIVGLFTATESISDTLLHGFVECLECDDPETRVAEETDEEEITQAETRSATRRHILKLLMYTLEQPAPNLAHFLLGFQLRKPVSKTNLQDPGVLGSSRTCLHSVLTLLERGVESRTGPSCLLDMPQSAELSYQLMYLLSANKDTSSPTMRYLRTAHDFLYRHLKHLPFQSVALDPDGDRDDSSVLKPQSWLLKAVAIELRLTSANRQRSHTQRLLTLLLDDTPTLDTKVLRGDTSPEPSQFDIEYSMYMSFGQPSIQQTLLGGQSRRKVLDILDSVDFSHDYPSVLELEYFNPSVIEQVVTSCEQRDEQGIKLCNVRMLHQILTNELNNLQATAMGQRPSIMQEIQGVCANMVERNGFRQAIHSKRQAFEAWRQVVEILLTACPEDQLQGETRQTVLFELLQDLLIKVSKPDAIPELTTSVAGVILTLMANLRQCFLHEQSEKSQLDGGATSYVPALESCSVAQADHNLLFEGSTGTRTLFASSLQVVLKGVIEHVVHSSSSSQRVRANLYGALLYYLQIAAKPHRQITMLDSEADSGVCGKLMGKESEFEKLVRENISTISSYGENFMEVLCRDASDGHDVGRMLALSCLDCILTIDRAGSWLSYMSTKGYLQHIVESLLQDDEQLQLMLQPNPEPLRALYILESKIGLLTRVAESATGAHILLQCSLMTRLAECTIFDLRPEVDRPSEVEGFIPSMLSRYRQHILFPVLKLCLAILTSLGIEHRQAAGQVLRFIVAHVDVFSNILRDRQTTLQVEVLTELALVTAVLSRAASEEGEDDQLIGDTATVEFRGNLSRLHRQMLALLPKYCLTEPLLKKVRSLESVAGSEVEGHDLQARIQTAIEEITANVTAFCRTIISRSGTNSQLVRIMFGPSLMEAMARDLHSMDELQSSFNNYSRPHNLGLVVYMLRQCCTQFMSVYDSHKQTVHKLKSLADLGTEELKELCSSSAQTSEKLSAQQRQSLAHRRLRQMAAHQVQQLQLFSYIVENCVYILWKHLDFYLLHCVPSDTGGSLYKLHARKQHMRRLGTLSDQSESMIEEDLGLFGFNMGVSRDELQQLKHDATVCVNETLLKKVQEIEQCYCRSHSRYGFVDALVRRIRRLLRLHTGSS